MGITFTPFHLLIVFGAYLSFTLAFGTILTLARIRNTPATKQWWLLGILMAPLIIQKPTSPPNPSLRITQSGMLYDNDYEFYTNGFFRHSSIHPFFFEINYGHYTQKQGTIYLYPCPTLFHSQITRFVAGSNRGFEGYSSDSVSLPQHYTKFLLEGSKPNDWP